MEPAVINAETWMADLLPQLLQTFGARLQYLGLQGSYRRGEATEASDIDVVVLLDVVALDDLDVYRAIVRAMPEGQKACGFIGGTGDLFHWPRHELFAFQKDTEDWFGKLEDFLPAITDKDAADGAKIGAAGLVHLLTHTYLYAERLTSLDGTERDIIAAGLNLPLWLAAHSERQGYDLLLRWCKDILHGGSPDASA